MELPVKPKDSWEVIDANGFHVCLAHSIAIRDQIVQAINSHEKFRKALERIKDLSSLECRQDELAADILIDQVQKVAVQALNKGE